MSSICFLGYTGVVTIRKQETELVFLDAPAIDTSKEVVHREDTKQQVTSSLVKQQLEMMWELNTVKYNYSGACSMESSKTVSGITVPLTKKVLIFTYDGYIKAGVDISQLDINVSNDCIYVTIPEPTVTDHVILEDSIRIIDQSSNILNPLEFAETTQILASEKNKMLQRALDNGLLEQAKRNAEVIIQSALSVFELQIIIN